MISVFDIFKIGIGPSSSHTVGPMVAAGRFAALVAGEDIARVECRLYGSLCYTGKGHGTDRAIVLGLGGETPGDIDPERVATLFADAVRDKVLHLGGGPAVAFDPATDIVFDYDTPSPGHPNALRFTAYGAAGAVLAEELYYSVGGGFVVNGRDYVADAPAGGRLREGGVPFGFSSAEALLALCARESLSVAGIVRANERAAAPERDLDGGLDALRDAMMGCIERGLNGDGVLPGGLSVRRRAKGLFARAEEAEGRNLAFPHNYMDRVSAYAIAVNEENAAGGRVVTSPTNGAAGVIPAVLRYYEAHCPGAERAGVRDFLLSATAFGAIIKLNASLSGAEVGCQGEIGSASAMAAAGLAAALGGTPEQVENAAEIALEHHLGMTCDPVGGLVQVPCIERNAMGAIKAINAASLSLAGDGRHIVSFDAVVETMRQTGLDLQTKYKETSEGGLAVTVVEC
jgi:L-serine dehydratase